jgi:hypothetical protein
VVLTFLFLLKDLWPTIPNSPQKMQWLARSLLEKIEEKMLERLLDCGIHLQYIGFCTP